MKIIGLTGFAKSGKSTAAEILRAAGGHEVAFAKHLKDVCSVVFGIERSHFDDQNFKEVAFAEPKLLMGYQISDILEMFEVPRRFVPATIVTHGAVKMISPRHVAQYIGTEVLRGVNPNIHIETAFRMAPLGAKFLICSDVRFGNELEAVNSREGIVIGISRQKAQPADLVSLHPSEAEVPSLIKKSDFTVENEATIVEFQATIKEIVENYLSK